MDETLADRIRAAKERYGVTQIDLAQRAGVSQPTISEALRGADVRVSTYQRITRALNALDAEPHEVAS